jgi:Na+/H+ antiporter NhaD/arsenite permease-like protein
MATVEMIDSHEGLRVITDRIKVTNRVKLYWLIGFISFGLSAVLDNMTTAIVMAALVNKFVKGKEDKWMLGGLAIIAANAGGAWSPIGDVTTIMLWIGGQVSTYSIMAKLFLPSLVCLLVPLTILSITTKGNIEQENVLDTEEKSGPKTLAKWEKYLVFSIGITALLMVPVIKTYTHLPPFIILMGELGILWIATEILHKRHPQWEERSTMTVSSILKKVDMPSALFFLGILLSVAGLQTIGHLTTVGQILDEKVGNVYAVNTIIGGLSAIVDNVPLVAGAMGMYPLTMYPQDHIFWELLALCAGTGGSILIIGSAAGVAVMGIMKIDFVWYAKKIGLLALAGYLAGIGVFWLMNN